VGERNTITRRTQNVECVIAWPIARKKWEDLPTVVQNRIRDLMDEAVDLVVMHA